MTSRLVVWFKFSHLIIFFISFISIIIFVLLWFRDIVRESLFQGKHRFFVERGIQLGIILFIFREIIFFFSFFWSFFHRRLSPNVEIGLIWPPFYLIRLNPFEIPLLNTLILLRRGVTVTYSHYLLLKNYVRHIPLFFTLFLGLYFTFIQFIEYKEASFNFSDRFFGRCFFIATGFHGIHVIIGSLLLIYSFYRILNNHFYILFPIGYELSIWYWHFVDIVWLFLFSFIYWWGF